MFVIECPWCGVRDQREFHCGGEDRGARPASPDALGDAAWTNYLFMRANPKGVACELWQHRHGCARWFRVTRSTASDEILATRPIEPTPLRPAAEATAPDRPDRPLREREG